MARHFMKIAEGVNVKPLVNAIKRQPELWNQHTLRTEGYNTPHSKIDDIWVRYNDIANFDGDRNRFNAEHESVWYPAYFALPQIRDIVFPLMNLVEGERLGGVLITRIPAGGKCLPHVDVGSWHTDYYDKYAVQLESAPGQSFYFQGENEPEIESMESKPGDIHWFNNHVVHGVKNETPYDRMTMIVCIRSHKK